MAETIRILLVDDQRLMREGLRILLELEPGLEIIGEAEDGDAALKAYARLQPDVVLMDVRMPGMDGVEATWRLRENWPEARVAEFARVAPPARAADAGLPEPLSERESEILHLLASGLTNRQIAERLSLAEGTVKNYVTTILEKLDARDRTQAAIRARELGLI
jgi:DNA-binding NarL/FixJ family response regulator